MSIQTSQFSKWFTPPIVVSAALVLLLAGYVVYKYFAVA